MKKKERKKKIFKKIQETKLHAIRCFRRDHLQFTSGIICGLGSVWGSFAVGDHLRRCTHVRCSFSCEVTRVSEETISWDRYRMRFSFDCYTIHARSSSRSLLIQTNIVSVSIFYLRVCVDINSGSNRINGLGLITKSVYRMIIVFSLCGLTLSIIILVPDHKDIISMLFNHQSWRLARCPLVGLGYSQMVWYYDRLGVFDWF